MESRVEIRPGRTISVTTYLHPNPQGIIFLIHGLGGKITQFREQIPVLKDKYTLILPDLYGHRHSDAPMPHDNNPYSFTEIYADLDVLFKQYAHDNNILIGHSYGGAFATALCFNHQDRVNKLILMTPAPCAPSINVPFVYRALPLFMLNWLRPLLERQFIKLAFNKTTDQKLIRVEIEDSRSNPLYLVKYLVTGMATIPPIDVRQLHTPTLLIMGMNDLLVPTSQQEAFYRNIPNLKVDRIKDAAHLVLLERPQQVNADILTFLENS